MTRASARSHIFSAWQLGRSVVFILKIILKFMYELVDNSSEVMKYAI